MGISIVFLASLYHVSVPVRTPWRRDLPGAAPGAGHLAASAASSCASTWAPRSSSTSAYGSLSAAVAVLFWLYVTALAVLIGAGLNAVVDRMWPIEDIEEARDEQTLENAAEAAEDADTELALVHARRFSRRGAPAPTSGRARRGGARTNGCTSPRRSRRSGAGGSSDAPAEAEPADNPVHEEVVRS